MLLFLNFVLFLYSLPFCSKINFLAHWAKLLPQAKQVPPTYVLIKQSTKKRTETHSLCLASFVNLLKLTCSSSCPEAAFQDMFYKFMFSNQKSKSQKPNFQLEGCSILGKTVVF